MSLRIHEVHPSLAHYPLALMPLSVIADIAGRLTGNANLMRLGGALMPIAAATGAATAVAGLVAQSSVNVDDHGRAHDLLATHRNLNAGLLALTGALAAYRARTTRPSLGYLVAGALGAVAMNYTAYLGGSMVYQHGVGVLPAGGVDETRAPEIRGGNVARSARVAGANALRSLKHAGRHVMQGELAPALHDGHSS